MADADATIYLVEQGGTQVGELAGGDERVGGQAVVSEELSQVQTLEGEGDRAVLTGDWGGGGGGNTDLCELERWL